MCIHSQFADGDVFVDQGLDALPDDRCFMYRSCVQQACECGRGIAAGNFHTTHARRNGRAALAQLLWRCDSQHPGQVEIRDTITTFGFFHIMRADDKRDALPGNGEEQIPQLPPRHRIDARRGFVQKYQLRVMQQGANQGQPLSPAA